jgi:hypothetical protein
MIVMSMAVVMMMISTKMVMTVSLMQYFHLDQVEEETADCCDEHDLRLNILWL